VGCAHRPGIRGQGRALSPTAFDLALPAELSRNRSTANLNTEEMAPFWYSLVDTLRPPKIVFSKSPPMSNFNAGDVLATKHVGFRHYRIYVGDNWVIHNSKETGWVELVTLEEFADNHPVTLSTIKPAHPLLAVRRAMRLLNFPYSLFSENCEHFVRTACGLVKESTQVQKYLISASGIGALLMADNNVIKAAGAGALIGEWLTPSEESPVGNAAVGACFTAGLAFLIKVVGTAHPTGSCVWEG